MKETKIFPYIDAPKQSNPPYLDKNLDLQEIFSKCVQELSLQQSKRDQLIAFYFTGTGLVATYIFSSDVNFFVRIAILIGLFFVGCIWSAIAIRYKVYKEVYWMCCKTVSSLYSANREQIDKPHLQHTFYNVVKKSYKAVPTDDKDKPLLLKYVKKNLASAEYLMFLTLVFLSAMYGSTCIWIVLSAAGFVWLKYVVVALFFAIFVFLQTLSYNKAALSVFNVVQSKSDADFNKIFEKAWLLHFFS